MLAFNVDLIFANDFLLVFIFPPMYERKKNCCSLTKKAKGECGKNKKAKKKLLRHVFEYS